MSVRQKSAADASEDARLASGEGDSDEPGPGSTLGRYQLLTAIASGGMGRVWAARHKGQLGFKKLVAVKTALPDVAREPEYQRMFLDEARIASAIQHPNVCGIYELGEENNTLYLAMEWVNGDSLSNLLNTFVAPARLDARVAAKIVACACSGLHAAHELRSAEGDHLNVVHRDVSPHNILLSVSGQVKVADFGVAKAHGQLHKSTLTGELKGKIGYMAPEQVVGQDIDRRADVFALGCVLYQATTGRRPFDGSIALTTMYQILSAEVRRPSEAVEGYPAGLEEIVLRALTREREGRFPNAEDMAVAIEKWLASTGPIVTDAQIGEVVRSQLGEAIENRKNAIREAAAGLTTTANHAPGAALEEDESSRPTSRRGRLRAAAVSDAGEQGQPSLRTDSAFSVSASRRGPVGRGLLVAGAALAMLAAGAGLSLLASSRPGAPTSSASASATAGAAAPAAVVPATPEAVVPATKAPEAPPARDAEAATPTAETPAPTPAARSAPVAAPAARKTPARPAVRPAPSPSAPAPAAAGTVDGLADRK